MLVSPSSAGLSRSERAQLSVLTNPAGTAASRQHALARQSGVREYTDGLARWQKVADMPPRKLPPKDAPLSRWSSSVDHPTCSPSISGDRVYTKIQVGDRVRLRPSAVPPEADKVDHNPLAQTTSISSRLYYGASRYSGDSFSEYVHEAGLDCTPDVPSRIDRGTIGLVKLVDLPKRECEVDFAFTRHSADREASFGVGAEEHTSSPRSRSRMLWHRVKFEELEVCECGDDVDAHGVSIRSSMKRTQERANATLRNTLSMPEVVAQREFRASRRENLKMWESMGSVGRPGQRRQRKKMQEMSANMSHKLHDRLRESGNSEYAAYFQVQQMYSAARAEFAEASSTVRGKSQLLLPVDDQYTDAALAACNAREFHRNTIADLNAALKIQDAPAACEALREVRARLEQIDAVQPTFLRGTPGRAQVRVALRKCNKRLEFMRGAIMHAEKVKIGRTIFGDKLAEETMCEIDQSEEKLVEVFKLLDTDDSGALEQDEIAKLIHYFQSDPPSEKQVSDAMASMDRDASGVVEFEEFLWWWREQAAGKDVVLATTKIQSHFRAIAEKRRFAETKFRIVQLQCRVRGKLGRRRFLRKRLEMHEMQAAADAETLRRRGMAATKVQTAWRGNQARKTAAQMREEKYFKEMEAASLKIQASYRGMCGRRYGETQRNYQRRLFELHKRAVRMWSSRTLGAVFDCWTGVVAQVAALRHRSLQRMAHAQTALAFDNWYEYTEACRMYRTDVLHELMSDLKKQVAQNDPQEQYRTRLHQFRNEAELNSAMNDFWAYRGVVYSDLTCGTFWQEARLAHYMAWVESKYRAATYYEEVPSPPDSMVKARVKPKKGIMSQLRKAKSQVARGILLRMTATKAAGVGPHSYNVTVEPRHSLNVVVEHGQKLSCTLQPDAVTPAAAAEVDHLLDRTGTEATTVWSHVSDAELLNESDSGAMLAWDNEICRATFDIEDTQAMRISGSIAAEDGDVRDCTDADGSHPKRKVGIFSIGLKDVNEWERIDDADSEGTPVYAKYEWAVVKQAPPAVLVRVALDPSAPLDSGLAEPSASSNGALSVRVVRAEGLAPGDGGWDKPDPYAVVRMVPAVWRGREQMPMQPGLQERKTASLDNTLSPVWNEDVEFADNLLMAPSPDMALFVATEEGETTQQTTLRDLRRMYASGSLHTGASVWWPALGRDLLDEDGDGDQDELNWISLAAADAELGISVAPDHGLAGAKLEIEVMDKDLLTKDDMVTKFPLLPLSTVQPLGKDCLQDFWIEAGVAVRPPRFGATNLKASGADRNAEVFAREAFNRYDTNGNGLLDYDELTALWKDMEKSDDRVSAASHDQESDVVISMLQQVDTDGSGEVSFDQFFVWYEEQVAKHDKGNNESFLLRFTRSLG